MRLQLVADEGVKNFDWKLWINEYLRMLKDYDDKFVSQGINCNLQLQPVELCEPFVRIGSAHPELGFNIWWWKGWSMFDVRICEFEMNQCMQAVRNHEDQIIEIEHDVESRISSNDAVYTQILRFENILNKISEELRSVSNTTGEV